MKKSNTTFTVFGKNEEQIAFRQMEYDMDGCFYGSGFVFGGILFCVVAIGAICNESYGGLLVVPMGLFMISFGLPLVVSYITQVRITDKEVFLLLGPVVIKRMARSDICTLAYSTMTPNIRGRPWTAEIIFLSPSPPTHIRHIARRWVKDEEISGITDPIEKEAVIMRKAAERYFQSSGFHLITSEGIWLEYEPERADKLKKLFPDAVVFISDISR